MNKKVVKYYKPYIIQLYGYLALIPFYFGFLTLKENFSIIDLVIFSLGLFFVVLLLFVNHIEPVIRVTEHKILLYNKFHNKPTKLFINDFESYSLISPRNISIIFRGSKYDVTLNLKDMKKFINFLEKID